MIAQEIAFVMGGREVRIEIGRPYIIEGINNNKPMDCIDIVRASYGAGYYDVVFSNGVVIRTFDVKYVIYNKIAEAS